MTATFPGARAPDRERVVHAHGLQLHVCEWGAPEAPPVLLAHGIGDHARGFDLLAPALADAGWRAVAWDQRGHGDSDPADLYSWPADTRDLLAVADSCGAAPMPAIGHSKGGSLLAWAVQALPGRFSQLVLLDGLSFNAPTLAPEDLWRDLLTAQGLQKWIGRHTDRQPRFLPTREALVAQRARANPRLPAAWIEHLVEHGAQPCAEGWRWKHDPRAVAPLIGPHPSHGCCNACPPCPRLCWPSWAVCAKASAGKSGCPTSNPSCHWAPRSRNGRTWATLFTSKHRGPRPSACSPF